MKIDRRNDGSKLPSIAAAAAAGALALMIASGVRQAAAEQIDGVVASVDGDPITSHDVKVYNASNSASGGPGGTSSSPSGALMASPPQDPDAVLKQLIQDRMLKS